MTSAGRPVAAALERRRADELERNQRVREQQLRRDGTRSPSENLAEGVALARSARKWTGIAVPRDPGA